MVIIGFSLYKLDSNAIVQVVSTMDTISIVALSLISTKSRELVKSLNLRNVDFSLSISGLVTVYWRSHTQFPHFYLHRDDALNLNGEPIQLDQTPIRIKTLESYSTEFEWRNPQNFTFQQFFEHFQSIFHVDELYRISFWYNIQQIPEIEKLKKLLPKSKNLVVLTHSTVCAKKILEEFLPESGRLSTFTDLFYTQNQIPIPLQNFGIQNLDVVSINNIGNLKLEDLLSLNAPKIKIHLCRFGQFVPLQVVVNRFIKNWIRGSNPRMKLISISSFPRDPDFSVDSVLRGIQYTIVPEDQEHSFETNPPSYLKRGFDIRSRNGRKANVQINRILPRTSFCVHVFD